MAKQLNIRGDEVHRLAHIIAKQIQEPISEVVLRALREYGARLPKVENLTPTQRASYEALMAAAKRASKHKKPGATSDHSDMYDEKGLPI
jgi:hypothetical protein